MDRHADLQRLANEQASGQAVECDSFSPGQGLPAVAPAPALSASERLTRIVRTIEVDIIPRLVNAHRSAHLSAPSRLSCVPVASAPVAVAQQPTPSDVDLLVQIVLSGVDADWRGLLQTLLERGVTVDDIYLGLLSPAARELGQRWDDDSIPFTDVTVAVGRIQRIMRSLSPAFGAEVAHPADGRRVLLLPAPGEQHTFGLSMVAEFFRRAAWDVVGDEAAHSADPAALVRSEWFDVIGISAGSDARLDWLKSGIGAVRSASRNRAIGVLVGGPSFSLNPELAALVGADATAVDGRQAPIMAEQLLQDRLRRL